MESRISWYRSIALCNQQEAGLLFSDDYGHLTWTRCGVLAANAQRQHSSDRSPWAVRVPYMPAPTGECGVVPAKKVDEHRHHRRRRCLCRHHHRPDLRQKRCRVLFRGRLAASAICITENVCLPASARWNSG